MASSSCDLRSSAVGDGVGKAEEDAASLLMLVDMIFRDAKRGEWEAENASLPAINSARRAEKSKKSSKRKKTSKKKKSKKTKKERVRVEKDAPDSL